MSDLDTALAHDALDGLSVGEAANRAAHVIEDLGASPDQILGLADDIADAINGAAAEIHLEIGDTVVTAEINDDDELVIVADGETIATLDISLVG